MKKSLKAILGGVAMFSLCITSSFAGEMMTRNTSYSSYSFTVPKLSSTVASAYNQTKQYSSRTGNIRSTNVGGNYTIKARMESSKYSGAYVGGITDNDNRSLPVHLGHTKCTSMRLRLASYTTNVVDVTATGQWRCDDSVAN